MTARHILSVLGLAACIALATQPLIGQQTLTLLNGDRLTGTLLRIDGAAWVFHYGGQDVVLQATDVSAFVSADVIGVRLADGTIGATTVAAAPNGGLRLALPGGPRTIRPDQLLAVGDPSDLQSLAPIQIGFLTPITRFWVADAAFGFSDKSGNSRARGISTSLDLERRTSKDRITIGFGLNREESESAGGEFGTTVSKYFGSLRLDVFASKRLFFFAATRQERDRFQDIALRSSYNLGLGYQAVTTSDTDLNFSLAGGARRENFLSAGSEIATVAALAGRLRHDLGPAVLLWQLDYSPEVQERGDFRLVSDASITAPLFKGIGFRLGAVNEYNSRPQPGIEKNDLLLTTQLSYTIGR